ncbi:MAG: cold shock domain-containing protein [Deferribacteres bacterium]|nr:cold shock domain-containing protein [candidate division KSB1 bacterium]MCB9509362.1 cold shock domain-containing protein [Deferribacteres bacterium]
MQHGKVKWFNENKGYGYILSEFGQEVFFHFTVIQMEGFKTLAPGALVAFEHIDGEKGPLATRVVKVSTNGLK